ncbi:MAG TPA: T9SS type A sorting domain-containing protein [Bacteroidia bacterium]|nr:T9SS type A sorting domain-containing protein [Bacteroidia bacterium]
MIKYFLSLLFLFGLLQNGIAQHTNFFSYQIGDYTNNIDTTKDGGYIVSGASFGNINGNNFLVTKVDKNGNTEWDFHNTQFQVSGDSDNAINQVRQTLDGCYIGVGTIKTHANPTNLDLLLVKLDSNGNLIWRKMYDIDPYLEALNFVFVEDDSTYMALGWGLTYNLLFKFNNDGDTLWTKKYPISVLPSFEGVIQFNKGYYIFGVDGDTGTVTTKQKIIYIDSVGNSLLSATHQDTADILYDISDYWLSKDSFILTYNHLKTPSNQYYFQINKYDMLGNFLGHWITHVVGKIANDSTIIGSYNHLPLVLDTLYFGIEDFRTGAYHEYTRYAKSGGIINSKVFMVDRNQNCLMGGQHDPSGFGFQAFAARFVNPQISGIEEFFIQDDYFQIFPNPASTSLNLQIKDLGNPESSFIINLYTVTGQKIVTSGKFLGFTIQLDISDIPSGFYLLQLQAIFNKDFYPLKKIIIY